MSQEDEQYDITTPLSPLFLHDFFFLLLSDFVVMAILCNLCEPSATVALLILDHCLLTRTFEFLLNFTIKSVYDFANTFDKEACQNYVRIMVVTSPGRLFVCGTNSFRPMCNTYIINDNNYTLEATKNGQAVCPYDPRHNSTSVFADVIL
uniref:Sema domain-containing protein n=1 Tax=Glossina pallidipes TaxID=7398 RepID=A0A1A9ZD51_GLOPL